MSDTFPFFGSKRGCEALAKSRNLHLSAQEAARTNLTWFYNVLNILDAKANGLMRVNSSFVTILLFFFGAAQAKVGEGSSRGPLIEITSVQMTAAAISLALVLTSTFLCFLIVRVNWKFLGNVGGKADGSYDFDSEMERLANVVDDRTHYYLLGWYLTLAAAAIPVVMWIETGIAKMM